MCATHRRIRRAARRDYAHDRHIRETYGITSEQYQAIYEAQNGTCAICRRATGVRRKLAVDHDHKTGCIRGLLCTSCNRNVLGHLRDSADALQRAIDYLIQPPAYAVIGARVVPNHEGNSV
ncbi:endonuclease VII domain-containing protein [Nocardia terpenica]|uniref:endonuclease VII domain-containing protein n=1 Tax=Nocardia terpenica TaxID=455432 RepID=UPI001E5668A0|nr:endonuclease VII domain-containing protein [Nocardia terpenica]